MIILEIGFWTCFAVLFYTYIGYPLACMMLMVIRRPGTKNLSDVNSPIHKIAVIIPAFNEATCISEKIQNTLSLNYPAGQFSVHVVADGSTDDTVSICNEFPSVICHHQPARGGKVAAIQRIIPGLKDDVLLLTDANCLLSKDSLLLISAHFSDVRTGAVAGEKKIANRIANMEATEGLYWQYESMLKRLDSSINTIVGAAGELFAVRRRDYIYLPEDTLLDDFMQSMLLCARGLKVGYEPAAVAMEAPSPGMSIEFERKCRIAAGAFQSMRRLLPVSSIYRQPLLFFQYVSHRVLRWTACPPALLLIFLLNGALAAFHPWEGYSLMMWIHICFYLLAITGIVLSWNSSAPRGWILRIPAYFTIMNAAMYAGLYRYINKRQTALWKKAPRNNNMEAVDLN